MKKLIYLIVVSLILGLVLTGCEPLSNISQVPATEQTKVKPEGNLAGAQIYAWHLSADVMPVPPYGSMDIPGSDTASKLIVNQPNGNTEVTITGVMNGLTPDTTYTVYLSKSYTPYVMTGWNVTDAWDANFIATEGAIGTYPHHMDLTQTGETLDGNGYYIPASEYTWDIDSGSVTGDNVIFHLYYTGGHPSTWTTDVDAYIQSDGSLQGTWSDSDGNSGTVTSYSGEATKTYTGSAGWPGLFTATVPEFTFTTDAYGSGSWHINLRDSDFDSSGGPGVHTLSVWINVGATILISDTFDVEVD